MQDYSKNDKLTKKDISSKQAEQPLSKNEGS